MPRTLWAIVWAACWGLSCAARAPAPPADSARPSVAVSAPPAESHYSTAALPGGVVGDSAERPELAAALERFVRQRGGGWQADGRLARLAVWALELALERDGSLDSAVLDDAARRLGWSSAVPWLWVVSRDAEGWDHTLRDFLKDAPANVQLNRYGAVVRQTPAGPIAAVAVAGVSLEIAPIPRRVRVGQGIRLQGTLAPGYSQSEWVLSLPDGKTQRLPGVGGARIDRLVVFSRGGEYRLELLAHGPSGVEVLLNVPVYAGIEPPAAVAVSTSSLASPEQAVESLLVAANAARRRLGVAPLELHAGLSAVAEAHSRDMLDHRFFGHDSPTTGQVSARVARAGLELPLLGENVGRGASPESVHSMLMASPGHRDNILNPRFTHVGIGVAVDSGELATTLFATQVFGSMAAEVDVTAFRDACLKHLAAARRKQGAPPLKLASELVAFARPYGERFFETKALTRQALTAELDAVLADAKRRPKTGVWRSASKSMLVVSTISTPEDLATLDVMLRPGPTWLGLEIFQGAREESGPHTILVVAVLAWKRK